MTTRVQLHLMQVGSCRHCERVANRNGCWKLVEFPSIAALIVHPQAGPVLFDTGYAAHFETATTPFPERLYRWATPVQLPQEQTLETQLRSSGYALTDIRLCLISHFHADHAAGMRDLPNARFIAMDAEVSSVLSTRSRFALTRHGLLPGLLPEQFRQRLTIAESYPQRALPAQWSDFGTAFDIFGDGSVMAVRLPGHSAGQMGIILRDQQDREVFLCADACWSRAAWQQASMPSSLTRLVMHDWHQYRQTLQNLHLLGNRHPEIALLPSHCTESLQAYRDGGSSC